MMCLLSNNVCLVVRIIKLKKIQTDDRQIFNQEVIKRKGITHGNFPSQCNKITKKKTDSRSSRSSFQLRMGKQTTDEEKVRIWKRCRMMTWLYRTAYIQSDKHEQKTKIKLDRLERSRKIWVNTWKSSQYQEKKYDRDRQKSQSSSKFKKTMDRNVLEDRGGIRQVIVSEYQGKIAQEEMAFSRMNRDNWQKRWSRLSKKNIDELFIYWWRQLMDHIADYLSSLLQTLFLHFLPITG